MTRRRLPPILLRAFTGDLQLLMAANVVEAATRFAAFVLYSRVLDPAELGVVAAVTAMAHLTNHLLQLGIDTAVLSLGSKEYGKDDLEELGRICRTGFTLQLAIGLTLCGAGLLVASFLARHFFDDATLTTALIVAFAGVPVIRLSRYGLIVLRAHQRFVHYAAASVTSTVVLVVSVGVLYWRGEIDVLNVIGLTLVVVPLVQLLVGLAGIPRRAFRPGVPRRDLVRRILGFGKWVWGTALLSSGMRRINVLLLVELAGAAPAGYFHMGRRYAEFLSLVFEPLRRYLVPKLTALEGVGRVLAELRRVYAWLAWTLLLLPLAWLGGGPLITSVQGDEWLPAVILFQVLVLARLLAFLAQPLTYALFSFQRPHVQTYVQAVAFAAYLAAALLVIPRWQGLGSALCLLLASVITLVALSGYVWRLARQARS